MFLKRKEKEQTRTQAAKNPARRSAGPAADSGTAPASEAEAGAARRVSATAHATPWRIIYNPEGDPGDIVAYGAAVAEGRIAGKYQLSNVRVPNTVVVQRSRVPGVIVGADVKVDREAASAHGVEVARTQRQGRNSARTVGTTTLSEVMKQAPRSYRAKETQPADPAVLIYTSGTTGNPKGVTLTHRNLHFQVNTIVRSLIEFSANDRVTGVLPMYHVFGLANSLVTAVTAGACTVLVPRYSPHNLLRAIADEKATILTAVPSMYMHLLAVAREGGSEVPQSLRYCVSGGAALPRAVSHEFGELFGATILEGYGLSETSSSVCANGQNGVFKEGSIGPPAPGVEMRVIDEEGRELPASEVGEIAIRSETVFAGYWNNPEATAAVLDGEGWFRTGDLAYRDEDGFFFITDRKKDIIITGGYNVSPREVEEVLMAHPKIADAAIVGTAADRDRDSNETITAYVVPRDGELSEQELREYCSAELAPYKRPRVVKLVTALPKSATGKVLRTQLRGEGEDRRLVEKE